MTEIFIIHSLCRCTVSEKKIYIFSSFPERPSGYASAEFNPPFVVLQGDSGPRLCEHVPHAGTGTGGEEGEAPLEISASSEYLLSNIFHVNEWTKNQHNIN